MGTEAVGRVAGPPLLGTAQARAGTESAAPGRVRTHTVPPWAQVTGLTSRAGHVSSGGPGNDQKLMMPGWTQHPGQQGLPGVGLCREGTRAPAGGGGWEGFLEEEAFELDHRWQTQSPWAESGPLHCFIWPSTLLLPSGSTELSLNC